MTLIGYLSAIELIQQTYSFKDLAPIGLAYVSFY